MSAAKTTFQVIEENRGQATAGATYDTEQMARLVAANIASETGLTVHVVENRLGGAHHLRAVRIATFGKYGLVEERSARHDPSKVRPGAVALLLAAGLGLAACAPWSGPAWIAGAAMGAGNVAEGLFRVAAETERKQPAPDAPPAAPKFTPLEAPRALPLPPIPPHDGRGGGGKDGVQKPTPAIWRPYRWAT